MQKTDKPNPYPVGSEAWHVRNLSNAAWGHVETVTEVDNGVQFIGVIYGPETFIYDPQKALVGSLDIPDEFYITWAEEAEGFDGDLAALWHEVNVEWVRKTRVRRETDG